MATRLKTVQYAFPALASSVNNTLTNVAQITITLPETGTKTFRSVVAHLTCHDIITATGGTMTTKTRALRLGAAAYNTVTNGNTLTNSGENISLFLSSDHTAHFQSNWTGTSMTCDFQFQINQSTGTTTGMANICVTLDITYEYDDTSTTQLKTVWIPLNAPTAAITTGAVTYDTAPALDTYLPETGKVYRNISLVVQGNTSNAGSNTDNTMTLNFGASTVTTGSYEGALASDRFYRYVWNLTAAGFTGTGATQAFQMQSSVARMNHPQVWLQVTYEFDDTASTSIMNSLMLPIEIASPMGGTAAADAQRADRELWIQEPGTITLQRLAFYMFWDQAAAMAGLNIRLGTGSYTTYTDTAAQMCGGNAAMNRNDAPTGVTLVRGRNNLQVDVYRTDTTDLGWNVSGFFIVNYTSGKSALGSGAHNRTVIFNMLNTASGAANVLNTSTSKAVNISSPDYFVNAVGTRYIYQTNSTGNAAGVSIQCERKVAEGGQKWELAYADAGHTDPEVGIRNCFSQCRTLFRRFPDDQDTERLDLEGTRRWRTALGNNAASFDHLDIIATYHNITYTVADNVSGFTGTVTIDLHRQSNGEKVKSTTRSGDGPFSLTWYDNTEEMFISARDSTNSGRSAATLAAGTP